MREWGEWEDPYTFTNIEPVYLCVWWRIRI
jgi:hypothetical protein